MNPILKAVRALWSVRHRAAPAVLALGLLIVGVELCTALPQEVAIEYRLGPSRRWVTELELAYLQDREVIRTARFRWPSGAPGKVPHAIGLSPGRYAVQAALMGDGQRRVVQRALRAPADGTVRVDLWEREGRW